MIPTYNGWDDTPEEEREELELWESESRLSRRSSQAIPRPDTSLLRHSSGWWVSLP
jgi:hypothetical protein